MKGERPLDILVSLFTLYKAYFTKEVLITIYSLKFNLELKYILSCLITLVSSSIVLSDRVILSTLFLLLKKYISSVFSILNLIWYLALSLTILVVSLLRISIFFLKLLELAIKAISSIYNRGLTVLVWNKSLIYIRNKIGEIGLP